MRNLIAAALAVLGVGAAQAADLPARTYTTAAPIFSWTGFYAGLSGGYGWCANCVADIKGGFIGGQVGYNYQVGPSFLLGVEADGFASWIGNTATIGTLTVDQKNTSFGTARGRAGFVSGPVLFYGTGGFAWAQNEISGTMLGVTLSSKQTQTGYAAGGGIEYAFAPNWSLKGEYIYMGLGSKDFFGVPSGDLNIHTAKVGVNYLFR